MTADTIPVDLLAAECMQIYKAKSAGNHITGYFREKSITEYGNDDGTINIEKSGRRDLSRTEEHGLVRNLERCIITLHRYCGVMDVLGNNSSKWAKSSPLTVFTKKGK